MGTISLQVECITEKADSSLPSAWVQGEILNQAATEDQVLSESGKQMLTHKVQTNKEARHLGL